MGTTTLSLFAGFALLIYAGVMAYECSVGVGGDLVPIKAQAGDRIYEPLTYRPSFMGFNHRIVPGTD